MSEMGDWWRGFGLLCVMTAVCVGAWFLLIWSALSI